MNDLSFDKLGDVVLEVLPEFRERFGRALKWWEGPDQYLIFGFVVKPALLELLESDKDSAFLKRLFAFFEEMARSRDIEVVNLLQVEVFENLIGDKTKLCTAWKYLGPATKKLAQQTAKILRLEHNLPPAA